ncbi:uncharacterized protein RMCC_5825 [Mycolicibacterium canariasense]|uniref:Uncharacterized protein n=1 Tax=Mycolicibacterium canariasense TaxID=228230 RepID=A0A100WIL8_MYCCR|nr:hypothetical protein [Mycolicibacterium canariasense]MCV7210201.1 hypothetical protein [Mycolicibacterium canariasense]ORU98471.1 hypothetical protein AWB94_28420 [Mycolicibacterium canariasense]GAS98860.1 uncharacterized protein RMCC_5825 [Mycolicibacterium canariasense]
MTAVRRVWCPIDAQDAWLAAHAVHAKGFSSGYARGGVLPNLPPLRPLPSWSVRRSRVLCEYVIPASACAQLGTSVLEKLNAEPMPVSRVSGRTRGRHRRRNHLSLSVDDIRRSL